jgi:hypothetical protein
MWQHVCIVTYVNMTVVRQIKRNVLLVAPHVWDQYSSCSYKESIRYQIQARILSVSVCSTPFVNCDFGNCLPSFVSSSVQYNVQKIGRVLSEPVIRGLITIR